jgi:SNF2 family DNA or RNA helicase
LAWSEAAEELSLRAEAGPLSASERTIRMTLDEGLLIEQPGVVSSHFPTKAPRTIGCLFAEGQAWLARLGRKTAPNSARKVPAQIAAQSKPALPTREGASSWARIKPPRDVVKLEDRLRMLLEPPLETLLSAEALRFPARPFAYQLDGVAFLYPRQQAVLADEMGLGKTMQAITAVRLLAHQGQLRRVLLVCPKPLVTNWQREFAWWAPEIPVRVVDGGAARRLWLWQQSDQIVTIANYEALVRDAADALNPSHHFDLVILDEAQRIKNRSSVTNQVVQSVSRSRSWVLTGTPIENSAEDLVGIFEFVAPGYLQAEMKPRAMGRAVSDHVLRRTKEHVLSDLPPKLLRDAVVELTPQQAESYRLAEEEGVVRLRAMRRAATIQHVFELVLRLKQICNFDPMTGESGKLERLEADLEECAASSRKAIVFSQWVQTLDELGRRLARFGPLAYHGQVPHRRREAVIEQFREDSDRRVLLMTYGAGGVGLNLQFASYVFLFDRWWNPAVEDQAINRAHRIGTNSPVTVTRFLTCDTIEQRINQILEEKRELFQTVFGDGIATPSRGLSREEVFSLFNLPLPDGSEQDVA